MGAAQRPHENIKPTPYCSTLWDQKEEEETENHYEKRVSHQKKTEPAERCNSALYRDARLSCGSPISSFDHLI